MAAVVAILMAVFIVVAVTAAVLLLKYLANQERLIEAAERRALAQPERRETAGEG